MVAETGHDIQLHLGGANATKRTINWLGGQQ